jgi:hypothetical protein
LQLQSKILASHLIGLGPQAKHCRLAWQASARNVGESIVSEELQALACRGLQAWLPLHCALKAAAEAGVPELPAGAGEVCQHNEGIPVLHIAAAAQKAAESGE